MDGGQPPYRRSGDANHGCRFWWEGWERFQPRTEAETASKLSVAMVKLFLRYQRAFCSDAQSSPTKDGGAFFAAKRAASVNRCELTWESKVDREWGDPASMYPSPQNRGD